MPDVSIERLDLDGDNPRLPESLRVRSQDALLQVMARDYSLIELARSFVDNGYFREEPLVTVSENGRYKVVEGNRRLAALRLLSQPDAVEQLRLGEEWRSLSEQWRQRGEQTVPIVVYESRDELVPFLGFRHISGIKRWDPKEKARFINTLLTRGDDLTYTGVARLVGSRWDSVRDNYAAYRIFLQARDTFEFDTSQVERRFGVLLRVIGSPPLMRHIGVQIGDRDQPATDLLTPVPDERADELRELIDWIFGMDQGNPIIRDSRLITKVGSIVAAPEALDVLRTTGNFALAYGLTEGEELSLVENLRKASYHLDEVKRDIDRHSDSARVRDLVVRCQGSLRAIIQIAQIEDSES